MNNNKIFSRTCLLWHWYANNNTDIDNDNDIDKQDVAKSDLTR